MPPQPSSLNLRGSGETICGRCVAAALGCRAFLQPDAGAACTLAQVISAAPDEQAQGRVGRSLTEQELGDLSDDQKVQILKIAEETTKVNLDKPKE